MSMRSWIRNLFARPATRPIRRAPHRARPWVEALEDRCVPSTFTVTNTLDDGSVGSLRWAVGQANSAGGNETINFNDGSLPGTNFSAGPHTITLTQGELDLRDTTGTETISGPGQSLLTISGNNASRVFNNGTFLVQLPSSSVALSGLTITGGNGTDLALPFTNGFGGGVENVGTLTMSDCTVSGNSAGDGGGLHNNGGTVTLTDCTFSDNSAGGGGGIGGGGTLTMTGCTVTANSASEVGGGVASGGTATLTNCTISGNTAPGGGGGVYSPGTLTMSNCTVSGNTGGGLDTGGTTTLTNCTVSGNTTTGQGGGLVGSGSLTMTNCTISGNTAQGDGGGIAQLQGSVSLLDCTISGNSAQHFGGGIEVDISNPAALTLGNTIVSGNTAPVGQDIHGSITTDLGYNLLGAALSGTTSGTGDVFSDAPLLAPLGSYGGPTQTMALLPGSPAIDAGNPSDTSADQRGVAVQNGRRDIGAFESSGFTLAYVSGSNQSTNVNTAFANPLVVQVTANNSIEPVAGGVITYTGPSSGAGTAPSTTTATIAANGQASDTVTADATAGTYSVTAGANGITNSANFSLTNNSTAVSLTGDVYVLNQTASGALTVSGNAELNVQGPLQVDSSSASAVKLSGNASINAGQTLIVGGDQVSGNAHFTPAPTTHDAAASVTDPLAGLAALTGTSATAVNLSGNQTQTLNPGVYASITVSGNAKLILTPGIYIIGSGGITISGNATVTEGPATGGQGVLLYNNGALTVSGNASVNLTASSTGTYAGLAIFQARNDASAVTVSGNANLNLNGSVLYDANVQSVVTLSGNAQVEASLVVNELTISGNTDDTAS